MIDTIHPTPRHDTPASPRTRFGEWLLRRDALARARATPQLVEPARALVARAREAARAGAHLLETAQAGSTVQAGNDAPPLSAAPIATAALELYGEAAYWALRALATDSADGQQREPQLSAPIAGEQLTQAFASAPAQRLLEVAGGAEALAAAKAALQPRTFEQASALSAQEREAELAHARRFVDALLQALEARDAVVPRLLAQRYGRIVGSLLGLALALVALRYGVQQASNYMRADLAAGASWRVSTNEPSFAATGRGFAPPEGGPNIFFQTQIEDSPWIEFDLGAPRALRGVSVNNRLDCCQDYALPLLVELSDDAKQWREVARRTDKFYYWTEWFPESQARYVRLRVERRTLLHLGPIKIR